MTTLSSAPVTTPITLRVVGSLVFCAQAAPAEIRNTANPTVPIPAMRFFLNMTGLFPVLVGFLLFVFEEVLLVLFFFLNVLRRFQLQRAGAHHFEIRATFVTTYGVAFVYIFFIDINGAIA